MEKKANELREMIMLVNKVVIVISILSLLIGFIFNLFLLMFVLQIITFMFLTIINLKSHSKYIDDLIFIHEKQVNITSKLHERIKTIEKILENKNLMD